MHTIFTVDVEGHVGSDPVERLIYGKTSDGNLCGIDMLMDILDNYKIRGLFFVDIAEAWDYGKNKIADVLIHIEQRGHDVGVHIHPDHMADRSKLFLSDYTYEQQYTMIKKCTDFYENILGHKPLAFRAGKYGANRTTLDILVELGYKVDFSEFYGQKWCHINPPVAKVNVVKLENGLLEIPVTSYESFKLGNYNRYDKIDCGQSLSEHKTVMEMLDKNGNDIAVLFAHSFSLIKWRRTPNNPRLNKKQKKILERQLNYVQKSTNLQNISLQEAMEFYANTDNGGASTDSIVSLTGPKAFVWFVGRAILVLKSRFDIKFRSLKEKST